MSHKGFLIVGNWKMNPDTLEEAKTVFSRAARIVAKTRRAIAVIAPPAPFMTSLAAKVAAKTDKKLGKKSGLIHIAVQDISDKLSGAFTGSISARQAKSAGAEYAIIGHSERRAVGDTDDIVAQKTKQALEAGLRVILCVGETERDDHARYLEAVRAQILSVLGAIDKKNAGQIARQIIFAYEPVWAIGKSYDTAPKPSDIHEMSIYIRKTAAETIGNKAGLKLPVLYGGSVDLENAKAIIRDGAIDGLLIGRQSLDPKVFGEIIDYADNL